jgi:two-component system, NtrC family, response regulator HydG
MPTNTIWDILVVDDDTGHRTMLKTLLSGWGYRVFEADDGSNAIEWVRGRPFDLILMDIRMVTRAAVRDW